MYQMIFNPGRQDRRLAKRTRRTVIFIGWKSNSNSNKREE